MPDNPFILKLGAFFNQSAGYKKEYPFELEEFTFAKTFTINALEGSLNVTRSQQGLLLQGKFSGKTQLECVRCLQSYEQSLRWELTELYFFHRRDAKADDLILPDNAQIDITEFVQDEAQLDIPINPLCKEDCQGLCQTCGTDLNLKDCGHEETQPEENDAGENSPFAALKNLLD